MQSGQLVINQVEKSHLQLLHGDRRLVGQGETTGLELVKDSLTSWWCLLTVLVGEGHNVPSPWLVILGAHLKYNKDY